MTTHGKRHAKQDIMDAAWKLFTEQGYDETTIAQIIELSGNSRSTFYHHFRGKDELLFSLAYSYDSDYDSWLQTCDRTLPAADLLLAFNHFVLNNLEHSPYMDLFAPLYGLQVATTGTRHILNPEEYGFAAVMQRNLCEREIRLYRWLRQPAFYTILTKLPMQITQRKK